MTAEEKYFEQLKFEHELINRRITWLLTSQTIMISAYGLILNGYSFHVPDFFIETLKWMGFCICVSIFISIMASFFAKWCAREDYKVATRKEEVQLGVRTWITFLGFFAEFVISTLFIVVWIVFLCNGND